MAVYTSLNSHDLTDLLQEYEIGSLISFEAISEGIENTNYFVTTTKEGRDHRWVLTLFENISSDDLPYFCDLTSHLSKLGFSVPSPMLNLSGKFVSKVKGRDAVIVPRFGGRDKENPGTSDCQKIGRWLAEMHVALSSFQQQRKLVRDEDWMLAQVSKLSAYLTSSELSTLNHFVRRYQTYQSQLIDCEQGTVHGDLFKDNVLFEGSEISGVIDFYHACDATLLFDLAVVANDWCFDKDQYDKEKLGALTEAYRSVRPWTKQESDSWNYCLELAALRFWISRLVSKHVPGYQQDSISGDTIKNPDDMKQIVLQFDSP